MPSFPEHNRGCLVLVGNPGLTHVGSHLRNAASAMHLPLRFCDSEEAFRAHPVIARLNWWMRGRRPARLKRFSREAVRTSIESGACCVISTGIAPLDADALDNLGKAGVARFNFLTDDPWSRHHRAPWFLRALPNYDCVFTPRTANMEDLRRAGCSKVQYLPFAYAPEMHYPAPPDTPDEEAAYSADVVFAGGADCDRVPYLTALIRSGIRVSLYGGYWKRYPETRLEARGHAAPDVLRKAIGGAKVALCLVRRANRDGHAMRTFELAASGACILAEDTEEHRQILGPDGEAAVYFSSVAEMLVKAGRLLRDHAERRHLAAEAQRRICGAPNTYRDRLISMLEVAKSAQLPAYRTVCL